MLASFNVDAERWENFKLWAKSKGSNASAELNRLIQAALEEKDEKKPSSQIHTEYILDIEDKLEALERKLWGWIEPLSDRVRELETELEEMKRGQQLKTAIVAIPEPVPPSNEIEPNPSIEQLPILEAIESTPETIPETAIAIDASQGLTDKELAARLGVSYQAVSYWRQGKRTPTGQHATLFTLWQVIEGKWYPIPPKNS